jgi:hypothetical protein
MHALHGISSKTNNTQRMLLQWQMRARLLFAVTAEVLPAQPEQQPLGM